MSTHLKAFTLMAILIASISGGSAFAQILEPIVVTTDQESYGDGDTIVISGEVRELLSGFPISLQVIAPNGNRVGIEQLDVGADKTFSVSITAGGPLWRSAGEYTVNVLYGTESRTAETTFQFGGSGGTTPGPSGPTIGVDRTNYVLSYKITGGSVLNIAPEDESNSLIIEIETTDDGELTITLPRELIDVTAEDGGTFFVLVDDEESTDFEEIETTATDRTLRIPFTVGSTQIEIIGSFVIPEFGTIAVLILAIAIISIIAVSSKTRLSILPKY